LVGSRLLAAAELGEAPADVVERRGVPGLVVGQYVVLPGSG
jgi:hypothetical protein